MIGVVDEAMADSRARGKSGQVARHHSMQVAVDPSVDFSLNDKDELLFVFFSMRPGRASARRQTLKVDSDAKQPSRPSPLCELAPCAPRFADRRGLARARLHWKR